MEEDAALLHKEFPELDLDLVESTLESKGGNLPEARAALVQLTASAESCAAGQNDVSATDAFCKIISNFAKARKCSGTF